MTLDLEMISKVQAKKKKSEGIVVQRVKSLIGMLKSISESLA